MIKVLIFELNFYGIEERKNKGELGKMEKELLELFEAVKKSADAATSCDGGAEESQCLDALEQLKNFPVTYQLLISTQVCFFFFFLFN